MSRANGRTRSAEKAISAKREQQQQEREHREEMQEEQAALQDAFNQQTKLSEGVIQELVSDEDITVGEGDEHGQILQAGTVAKINNMLSRDWVLSNLTEPQEHDIRYKLEVMKLKVIGMHPPEEGISGEVRAFLMDDREERLDPLTQQERVLIDELFETLKARLGRGREGFERKQQNTSIAHTQTGSDQEAESSTGWGLFS